MDLKVLIGHGIRLDSNSVPIDLLTAASYLEYGAEGHIAAINFNVTDRDTIDKLTIVRTMISSVIVHECLIRRIINNVYEVYKVQEVRQQPAPEGVAVMTMPSPAELHDMVRTGIGEAMIEQPRGLGQRGLTGLIGRTTPQGVLVDQPEEAREEHLEDDLDQEDEDAFDRDGGPNGYMMRDGIDYSAVLEFCSQDITKDELPAALAERSGGNLASTAKLYSDKVRVYNDLMSRLSGIQREIRALSDKLSSDEVVKKIVDGLEWMSKNCPSMESYKLTKSHIVITTTELNTDNAIEGHVRKLGKFAILINLAGLVGSIEAASSERVLVRIFNLTRTHHHDDNWMCGHVQGNGIACFGNATSMLIDAFAASDVFQVLDIVLRFIRNPDPNDQWGEQMKCWPWADGEVVES
jgi:hypothetical protein